MMDLISDIRFILAYPFGLVAEVFALLAIKISGDQCEMDFTRLRPQQPINKHSKPKYTYIDLNGYRYEFIDGELQYTSDMPIDKLNAINRYLGK